jgi:thiamine pyrophosphate-dependent acetolactate synthase large subunit-like protein
MLTKEEVLRPLAGLRSDAVVVTTMGIVRPWGRITQSELDFASADSAMGHAADLALGIAIAQPLRKVICLNGDGSMLMTLGTLASVVEAGVNNYFLFVIENWTYEITGNQTIPGAARLDFVALARGAGFKRTYRFDDSKSYAETLPHVLSGEGPVFVLLRVEPGSEGPISRSEREEAAYLKVSIAESAHAMRRSLCLNVRAPEP